MKVSVKIIRAGGIVILSAVLVLFLISLTVQDKVAGIILKSLNRNLATRIETGSYHLSLIKKFPKASFELRNIVVYSSPDFNKAGFKGINTDTLLTARSASIDFKMADLLRNVYTFKRINVKSGKLNLYTDTGGRYNYSFSRHGNTGETDRTVKMNLNRVNLSNLKFVYNDLRADLIISGEFDNGRVKSRIRGNDIDFNGNSELVLTLFKLGKTSFSQRVKANLEVGLNKNAKGIFFRKSTLRIDKRDIILKGFIASDNYLDLDISGKDVEISNVFHFLPVKPDNIASELQPSGILDFDCFIKGKSTRYEDPHYEISLTLKDGGLKKTLSTVNISRLAFDASITNGSKNRPESGVLKISNFTARIGNSSFKGSFTALDFSRPNAELYFSGEFVPSEFKEFLDLKYLGMTSGSIGFDINLSGTLAKKDHYIFSDLTELNSSSEFVFKSFGIEIPDKNLDLKNANGKILISKSTSTDRFDLVFNNQNFRVSFDLQNFPEWLSGKPVMLTGKSEVYSPSLRPQFFMRDYDEEKKPVRSKAPLAFPGDITIDLSFSVDTLEYKKFDAQHIRGELSFKPWIVNFKSIRFNSQDGVVSGNGLIVQNRNKSFIGRGSFTVNDVDVNKAFYSFNNFGQNFLKAENIAGTLSGTITLMLPADSMLNPVMKSLTAEGKYSLSNGALINFDPVKALSKFIELSELENIKFDKLDNDFFIRNNYFYVPMMEIKSSAVDLSVNGKHSFDNDYQYHVQMLLSEILSKKARRKRALSSEFGDVEDDGLGRTKIFLKLEGKGEMVDVSYDIKAVSNKIKNDIMNERRNLKNILNEDYGSLSSQSKTVTIERAGKPRFRISWEGYETGNSTPETSAEKKEGGIRKIFRKK